MGQGLGGVSCPNQRDAQSDLGGERPFRRGRRGVAGVQARCDRPYRVRRCGSGPARLQSPRRHGGDRGRQEIVGRVARQRISRPYRRFSVHRRLGLCCRLAGARLVRRAGRGVNRLCPRVRRLARLRAGFSRADGQAAAHGRPDSSLRRRRRRVVVYRHPVCPDCGRGHHRRRLGRDVRNPHARHRRQAQGKLSCGCPIS
jgi:hypothetical protein